MKNSEIKQFISDNVLNLDDSAKEYILRSILFDSSNTIDWQKAYDVVVNHLPQSGKLHHVVEVYLGDIYLYTYPVSESYDRASAKKAAMQLAAEDLSKGTVYDIDDLWEVHFKFNPTGKQYKFVVDKMYARTPNEARKIAREDAYDQLHAYVR